MKNNSALRMNMTSVKETKILKEIETIHKITIMTLSMMILEKKRGEKKSKNRLKWWAGISIQVYLPSYKQESFVHKTLVEWMILRP